MQCSVLVHVCIVLVALALLHPANAGAGPNELIGKIQPATVTIHVFDGAGNSVGQGSGFLFKAPGHLITNYHVLGKAVRAIVKTHDGRRFNIKSIVAESSADDLVEAVVDITSGTLPCLGPARIPPKAGDPVMVVSTPMGVEMVVSQGTITSIEEVKKYGKCIVHTAHSYPGSSGSPVVNAEGEVIGITTAAVRGKPNINVAVPVERFSGLTPKYRQLQPGPPQPKAAQQGGGTAEPLPKDIRPVEPGDPAAMVGLAIRYETGQGMTRNCFEALNLYRKAAGLGYAPAEYHVGRMYYDGRCMGRNFGEAARWLRKAAGRGDSDAQLMYGKMCYNGDGIARDRIAACQWVILSASRNNPEAVKLLRLMTSELTQGEFKAAEERARNWTPSK